MGAYTAGTMVAIVVTVAVDLRVLRTRLVTTANFWISWAIMALFQVFVDGWLTRATDTIVIYRREDFSGVRVFFNSPIEDFGFGFALILLTLSVWTRLTAVRRQEAE